RKEISVGLMIAGVLVGGAGIYVMITKRVFSTFFTFPGGYEAFGLLFIGLTFLGCGVYTQLTLERPATVDAMRLLLLYAGSLTGLLIALVTGLRIVNWWSRYIVGGITVWQGEEGWHFWYCIYGGCIGLALLFGSLLLARVDVRVNPVMRRTLYGYNTGLN